jgi:hypothetical protein
MVSKCANPKCQERFRYLHEGKLFRLDVNGVVAEHQTPEAGKTLRRLEFFWLCDSCAGRMTLRSEPGRGVTLVQFARVHRAAS